MVNLIDVPEIEVAHAIKVHVAAVVAERLAHDLAILQNCALEILLTFLRHLANFEKAVQVVGFVVELELARHLLVQGAHHCIEKFISWRVTSDHLAVVELYFFVARCVHRDRAHTKRHLALCPRRIHVAFVRSDDQGV